MSWNGATDYDSWTIYAGTPATNLINVATVAKDGFETEYTLVGEYGDVFAEANLGGKSLSNSTVVSSAC